MEKITTAVILVAGLGSRLRPFTDSNPKCFASIGGIRILDNALAALASIGCERVRLVVGHRAEQIETTISRHFGGMTIEYILNDNYTTTNSMYSLELGLKDLDEPSWVLEGDVYFESGLLSRVSVGDIAWYVDSTSQNLDGAYVESSMQNRAQKIEIVRDVALLRPNQSKSVGILKLTRIGVHQLRRWLEAGITEGKQNLYYDLIIAQHMHECDVRVVNIAGCKWFEVDSMDDLEKARRMFA